MYPLDVTHVVLRRWRAGVRGRIDPRIGIGAGAPACLRRQACSCPSHSGVLSHAWCQACVDSHAWRIYFGAFAAYTPPFAAILVPFESASNFLSIDTTLAR